MERFRQKQMKLDKLTQPGWVDAAGHFRDRDEKYRTTKLKVPVVVQPQTTDYAGSFVSRTFGVPMATPDSVPRKLQMPHVTSWPGTSHMRLGPRNPETHERSLSLQPTPMPDWSPIQQSKHGDAVTFNSCISRPKLITR